MPTATRAISTCWAAASAIVMVQWLKRTVMDPNGFMDHRLNDVERAVLWGNPVRQQGIRSDNGYLSMAKPDSAGIQEGPVEGLEQAPFQIREYGHAGSRDSRSRCTAAIIGAKPE